MQRTMVLKMLVVALVLAVALPVYAQQASLLKNGAFADGLTGWNVYRFSGSAPVTVDEQGVRITTSSANDRLTVNQTVKIDSNQTYILTAQVKTEGIQSGRGGYIRVQFKNSNGKSIGQYPQTQDVRTAPQWTDLSLKLVPPAEATAMVIELFMEKAAGTIWYRNVQLVQERVAPVEPIDVTTSVHSLGAVTLNWRIQGGTTEARPTGYVIYRSVLAQELPSSGIPIALVAAPPFVDRSVKADRTYYYQVVPQVEPPLEAKESSVVMAAVGTVSAGQPPMQAAAVYSPAALRLTWQFAEGVRVSYLDIYRQEGVAEPVFVTRAPAWRHEVVDTGLNENAVSDIRYRMVAVDPDGNRSGDIEVPISGFIPRMEVKHGFNHPYLVVTAADIARVQELVRSNAVFGSLLNSQIKAPAMGAAAQWATPQSLPPKKGAHADLARTARTLGLAYQFYHDTSFVQAARHILLTYADQYKRYPTEVWYSGRVTAQTLEEAGWLIDIAWAYDLIYNELTLTERSHIENDLLREAVAVIQGAPRDTLNWQVWHDAGLAAAGFVMRDEALMQDVLYGELGVCRQVRDGVLADGLWHEQSIAYHLYTLDAFTWLAMIARNSGYDVFALSSGDRTFKSMYDAPFYHAFSNLTQPSTGDSPALSKLTAHWAYGPALQRYGDPKYAWLLRQGGVDSHSYPSVFTLATLADYPSTDSFSIGSGLFAPLGRNTLGSTLFADTGMVVMRGQVGDTKSPSAAIIYKPRGTIAGHQHADNLSLYLSGTGKQWLAGSGRFDYYPGQTDERQGSYARHTVAKNTLVVDGKSQIPQRDSNGLWNVDGTETSRGRLDLYVPGPTMQLTRASSSEVYPGVQLTRTIVVTHNYVLDLYDATSATDHGYQWISHVDATPADVAPGFTPTTGVLGASDGLQYIRLQQGVNHPESPIHTRWESESAFLDHWFISVGTGARAMLGSALWSQAPGERSVFVGEVQGKQARFISLFAPTDGNARVVDVTWLDESQTTLRVEHDAGWDLITLPAVGSPTPSLSVVRTNAVGAVTGLLCANGQGIEGGGMKIESSQPTSFSAGVVDGVWVMQHEGPATVSLTVVGTGASRVSGWQHDNWTDMNDVKQTTGQLHLVAHPGDTLVFADALTAQALHLRITLGNP